MSYIKIIDFGLTSSCAGWVTAGLKKDLTECLNKDSREMYSGKPSLSVFFLRFYQLNNLNILYLGDLKLSDLKIGDLKIGDLKLDFRSAILVGGMKPLPT